MAQRRGISILDLVGLPAGSQTMIPAAISDQLEKLAVLDYSAVTAGDVHIYRGTVQCLADMGLPALRNWPVDAPMLNTGLPFQLIRRRATPAAGDNVEPAPQGWQIDFMLDRIAVTIPGLRPALRVESQGTTPRHLAPDPSRKDVRIVGGGTLRLVSNPAGAPAVMFVSPADPIDPDAPAGAVAELTFDPPHFFIGQSQVGLTVDRLVYDDSQVFTPADIAARGHGADWQGVSIREATVYLPPNAPLIGDLSTSVRDVLLGTPAGIQGELQIEFGVSNVSPQVLRFTQNDVNGGEISLPVEDQNGKATVTYTKLENTDFGHVKVDTADPTAQFQFSLPDGSTVRGSNTGYFDVRNGAKLGVQSIEIDQQNGEALSLLYPFYFKEGVDPHVPTIGVSFPAHPITINDASALANVLFVSARREQLQGIHFTASTIANSDSTKYKWQLGAGIGAETGQGQEFAPPISPTLGFIDLLLTDDQKRQRRLRVEVITEGPMLIGTAKGVFKVDPNGTAEAVKCRAVEATYDAATFNPSGLLMTSYSSATVQADGSVKVEDGTIAGVTVEVGDPNSGPNAPPPAPPAEPVKRHLQVLMEFNTPDEYSWGTECLAQPFSPGVLQDWANGFGAAAHFVVIGRTCDIGTDPYNKGLAEKRADRGVGLLAPAIDQSRIFARGEFDPPTPEDATEESAISPPLTADEQSGHLIKAEHPELTGGDQYLPPRQLYRRVDIYAVGGQDPSNGEVVVNPQVVTGPAMRRALVPGPDITSLSVPDAPGTPKSFRVRLTVSWDSPTVVSLADAIPTLAEILVTWQKTPSLALPETNQNAAVTGPATFTLIGRWTYDSRTGATLFSLAFNSDGDQNGLFHLDNAVLATAMMLAPALLSGITADSPSGIGARLGALLGASVFAASSLVESGRVVVHGIEIQEQQRALGQFGDATHRILLDYTAELNVNIDNSAIQVHTNNPLKVRFENCGLEYDGSKTGLAAVNLVYDEAKFDVADPGEWVIGGDIGKLLRVAGTRAGSGSTWMEVDLEFALDLGVIKIAGATVRITFPTGNNDFGFELRGLAVEVNIPGTLQGKGRMALGQGGDFEADLSVRVIPAGVEARASLRLKGDLKYLEVGVILPVGIPLGATGLGIFGFIGRFVVNGQRAIATTGDPVENEIKWYRTVPSQKYGAEEGQFALGLGVVVGTLPDTAFSFNAVGMLTVAFPDPEVVISVDAKLMSKPSTQPVEKGEPGGNQSVEMLGIIAVNSTEFIVGIRGHYSIPKVLDLKIPISGYFPINDPDKAYYFRIGCDGVAPRTGDPVTAVLLPGVVDFKCWLFVMMEEKELINLGNAPKYGCDQIDLHGFCLGFGAGFDIDWSAGPISLHASAIFLLGLGTNPLTLVGMIAADGELDLVIVSATVDAFVEGKIQRVKNGTNYVLDGDFSAEVDLGLGSVGGTIHIHLEDGPQPDVPEPLHPLTRVDLTDRRGTVTGTALKPGDRGVNTVWPDTTPVLSFSHYLASALQGGAFDPGTPLPGEQWCGSSDLKYAFRLTKLELRQDGVAMSGPLDSV